MRNALVVARRELSQLFHAPLAYVFLILFVVLVQLLPVLALFVQGQADLRMFFDTLPWGVVLFAAFVTMRSWAEERQENTYEMLLTFPMRDRELVLGKFVASFTFLLIGLACTAALPLAVAWVGDPDGGAIAAGYLGNVLLAAMWCAGGVFFSGLTRSQLLAVIVTAFLAIVSLILGTDVVSGLLDVRFAGLGSFLESMIGGWSHYASFAKGVAELADTAYFVAWTLAFLWLNALFVGLRRRPGSSATLAIGTPLAIGCAMLVGRLTAGDSWARADLTDEHLYTLSPATVRVLTRAKVPVRVTYYVSSRDDLPKELQTLERDVMDRLREMEIASGGRIVARVSHLKAEEAIRAAEEAFAEETSDPEKPLDPNATKETSQERRVAAKGVRPFPVATLAKTETSTKLIYSTLTLRYREKDEELLPQILPEQLGELEYVVAQTVSRLVRPRPPKIALVLGQEPMDPQLRQFYLQNQRELPDPYSQVEQVLRAEKFDVARVALSAHEPLPDDYDALVVIGPTALDDRQTWEINRALVEGKPTLLALQRYTWEYRVENRRITPQPHAAELGLDAVLEAQGLGVSRAVLMDEENVSLRVPLSGVQGAVPLKVPMHVQVKPPSMNADCSITRQLPTVLYVWGTALSLDEAKLGAAALSVTRLLTSSPRSWTTDADPRKIKYTMPATGYDPQPLAVLVRGQFKDALAGKERPAWPMKMEDMMRNGRPQPAPPDPPAVALRPAPGQLILMGCARHWQNGLVTAMGDGPFLLNCIDSLTLDEDLLQVRARQASDRRFNRPSEGELLFWSALPLGIVPLLIVGVGLGVGAMRMRRREAWESEHGR